MAATAEDSYVHLMAELRRHDNYDLVFRQAIDELVGQVDFTSVNSCLAFGTGSGEHEIHFARCLLPNLGRFTAVEPDGESVRALRANVETGGQLPGIETTVVEGTLKDWMNSEASGVVDAVLLFNVLAHTSPQGRRELFQKLVTQTLNPGGIVVVIDSQCTDPCDGYVQIQSRLGSFGYPYHEMEADLLAASFIPGPSRDIVARRDLSNASDDAVKFLQLIHEDDVTFEQVRSAIDDVFGQQKDMTKHVKRLGVFSKQAKTTESSHHRIVSRSISENATC